MQVRGVGRNGQNYQSAVISENDEKKVMERKLQTGGEVKKKIKRSIRK
jgi:hypothetical protein